MSGLAPGRYCLAICYCGKCPHYKPFKLTGRQWSMLFAYLNRAPRYENNNATNATYMRDPLGLANPGSRR